jgi:hypothetical protein
MSSVNHDCGLGRKFQSTPSKRKRKSELEQKNPELNCSLLKFFKRNYDASVSNNLHKMKVEIKCDSSNGETVHKFMATAEAAYLNRPLSVNDNDPSAVAMENQHKMLRRKPESHHYENLTSYSVSYNCEPQKIYASCDPDEQIPQSDSH